MNDKVVPISRQQRRALERATAKPVDVALPPLCRPGHHKLGPIEGTVEGKVVARVVMCSTCRRTFQQILDEDPEYAAMYAAWVAAGEPDDWPPKPGGVRL